jgi:hypothetical protein
MMPHMTVVLLLGGVVVATLGAIYLWSGDPDRRGRAWRLLKLLLNR